MRVAFVSQPWAGALPPSESIAIWNQSIARLLAAGGEHPRIYASAAVRAPGRQLDEGVDYRFISATPDWRALRVLEHMPCRRRQPLFASRLYFAAYARRIAADLRRDPCDVVHVHNFSQFVPVLRRALPDAKVVLHMHCEWLSALDRSVMRRRLRGADLILGCSDYIARLVREALPELDGRVRSLPNGVDPAAFEANGSRGGNGRVRLLTVGRVSPEKGFHVLVPALARLLEQANVELEWVGAHAPVPPEMLVDLYDDAALEELRSHYDGPYAERVLAAAPAHVADRITFSGPLPFAALPARYAAADLFVLPSLTEAFGMPLVEAMASGLPVVASATGGIVEVVENGRSGLLCPRGDAGALAEALGALVRDPGRRAQLGAEGRRHAQERYAWPRVLECLLESYEASG